MKSLVFALATLVIIGIVTFIDLSEETPDTRKREWVLAIHGGAGSAGKNMPDSIKERYYAALSEALTLGKNILSQGGSSLDAVEQVIIYLENNEMFNAGRGGVLTSEGYVEMDASIMYGKDLSCGGAAGLKHIKNPITLARVVMEKTPHILFSGSGAEELATRYDLEFVEREYFVTPQRREQFLKRMERLEEEKSGTVGAVALDMEGNLAAATSTGGMSNKMPGRIGDSPIINSGTYADNETCAVSSTGWGEKYIINAVAFSMNAFMKWRGMTLKESADEILFTILQKGEGGLIAVDKNGNYVLGYNTESMLRGVVTSDGIEEVKILNEE